MVRTSTPAARSHYVVDGSNIATEGRQLPSLQQLNEAVLAFIDEHPDALITVVVDATFGHRIDKSEVQAFDEAVANNELVTPPAGAVGRGDAFVLTIANKAKADILSNDSFQEFHGDYPWLFDSGRLIGGKPVPHVGWVFVERLPVRGPKSRQSVKEAKRSSTPDAAAEPRRASRGGRGSGSPLAAQPMPVPTAPPPGKPASTRTRKSGGEPRAEQPVAAATSAPTPQPRPASGSPVNDLLPFLEFVERHPVGTSCTVVIESYASHGAYARAGDVLVYLPLRLMGNPMPRSARAAVTIGDAIAVVIAGYTPERRSIDAALPSAAEALVELAPAAPPAASPGRGRKRASVVEQAAPATADIVAAALAAEGQADAAPPAVDQPPAASGPAKKPTRRSRAAKPAPEPSPVAEPQPAAKPVRKRAAKVAAEPAPAASEPAPSPVDPAPAKRRGAAKRAARPAPEPAAAAAPAEQPAPKPVKQAGRKSAAATKKAAAKPAPSQAEPAAPPAAKKPARKRAARPSGDG